MAFTKIAAAGIGSTETVTLDGLTVINNVSIGGTLTYEDVTNVDSVGLITARNGIVVGSGITLSKDGDGFFTGVITATSYAGDGSALTGIDATQIVTGNTSVQTVDTGSDGHVKINTEGSERLRIKSTGEVGIGNNNPGELLSLKNTSAQCNMSLQAATNGSCAIFLGDTDSVVRSAIKHHNTGDYLAFFTGGNTERLRIDSSGRLLLGTTTEGLGTYGEDLTIGSSDHAGITIRTGTGHKGTFYFSDGTSGDAEYKGSIQYDHSDDSLRLAAGASERLRITSDGRLLVGQTSAIQSIYGSLPPRFSVSTTTASPAIFATFSNDAYASRVDFLKSRNATVGSHTVVQAGDALGEIYFGGSDGDQFHGGALIQSVVESGVGDNDMPADLRFFTNGGTTNISERLRITSAGKISYLYDGATVSTIADVDLRTNNGVHIRGVDGNSNDANIYLGGAVDNQRKTAIIHDPNGGYCRGDLHFCLENSADLSDVDVTDSKMKISAAGNVTMPSQACMVFGNAIDVSTPSNNTPLQFSGLEVSKGGMSESNSRSRITVPTTGVYLIHAMISGSITSNASTDGIEINILKNGSVYPNVYNHPIQSYGVNAGDEYAFHLTQIVSVSANDYLEVCITNINSAVGNIERGHFAVSLLH